MTFWDVLGTSISIAQQTDGQCVPCAFFVCSFCVFVRLHVFSAWYLCLVSGA
jgi:hypothetical protein